MNWRNVVIPFGKHKGWTMFQAYVNDYDYVLWLSQQENGSHVSVIKAACQAVEHKDRVDPFSVKNFAEERSR